MNPAALKSNLAALESGGTLIVNEDAFTDNNLRKAGYEEDPLEDGTLDGYQVFRVPMTSIATRATEGIEGLKPAEGQRTKNVFALGLVSWMYGRPPEPSISWLEAKFAKKPAIKDANVAAFKAGYNFGETTEIAVTQIDVEPAPLDAGEYRNVDGTQALALGLIAASVKSGLQPFFATYPITPASELLHHLARHDRFGVRTVQAEDEIAAVNMALGAAFAGHLGITATSGPGMDLKAETIGLAAMLELPLVVVDVQRAGPSTGMPTKTEQTDLLMALHGRHGESPLPVIAASTPADCFDCRGRGGADRGPLPDPGDPALRHLPRQLLGALEDPRRRRPARDRPRLRRRARTPATSSCPTCATSAAPGPGRSPARPACSTGSAASRRTTAAATSATTRRNHALMTELRAKKLEKLAEDMPELEVEADEGAELLVLGWGSTYGVVQAAARRVREREIPIATAHLRSIDPLPRNTGEVVRAFPKLLIPEVNTGQLLGIIRGKFLVDAVGYNKMEGLPIFAEELEGAILEVLA